MCTSLNYFSRETDMEDSFGKKNTLKPSRNKILLQLIAKYAMTYLGWHKSGVKQKLLATNMTQ